MRKSLFFFLILMLVQYISPAQQANDSTEALNRLLHNLDKYQKTYPQEKVYLHIDKPYYVAGEDIWFKAYVTISQFNFLSAVSKIMYVELINNQNEIVQSRRLPVISGLAVGDFKLPDTLLEGSYRIRAYTNWMRNFDEDRFFDRTLVIGNSFSNGLITSSKFTYSEDEKKRKVGHAVIHLKDLNGLPVSNRAVNYEIRLDPKSSAKGKARFDGQGVLNLDFTSKDKIDINQGVIVLNIDNADKPPVVKYIPIQKQALGASMQFYPEGGVLLSDVTNKIGFKALNEEGKGVSVKGVIESAGQQVTTFASDHNGIGNLSFSPEEGKTYQAIADFGNGKTVKTNLPASTAEGFTIAVNNSLKEAVWLQINASPNLVNGQSLSIVVQNSGQVFFAAKSKLSKAEMAINIPKKNIPSGVIHFSLFDEKMNLLAERAVFNLNETDVLPIEVKANKNIYTRREQVALAIKNLGINDSSRIGSFSIAVTNMDKVADSAKTGINIFSSLLLSAEAKGYIEEPGYYFKEDNPTIKRQLDNLMLTQTADRSFWEEIKKGEFPEISYQSEKEIRISGTITKPNGEPVDKAKVMVISPQNISTVLDTVTGPDGRFNFDKLIFYDSTNFVVQARDARGKKNVEIKLDEVPRQQVSQNKNSPDVTIDANRSLGNYLDNAAKNFSELQKYGFLERSIVLEEVEIKDKKKDPAKYSANLNGAGRADQVISGDEIFFNGCPTLDVCLNGRLVGVIFRNGIPYSTRSQNRPMQIILDGVYMDASALSIIQPTDVASIEVLRTIGNTAIYGSYGGAGVLIITTRRGDQPRNYSSDLYTPGITTFSPQGFYEIRTFMAPDYSSKEMKSEMKDLRSTIYWKPDVVTNADGTAEVAFYTADEPGVYQIVVEGLDTEGHLARSITYITVK